MRRGRLQFGQSGVDVGETGEVGGESLWLHYAECELMDDLRDSARREGEGGGEGRSGDEAAATGEAARGTSSGRVCFRPGPKSGHVIPDVLVVRERLMVSRSRRAVGAKLATSRLGARLL